MDEVTTGWLDSVLRRPDDRMDVVHDLRVHRWRGKPHSLLLKLIPTYAPAAPSGLPRSFVLKLAKPGPPSAAAERRRVKEHAFYTTVAPAMPDPPLVRVWSAGHDPASGATHLLMDDLEPTHTRPPRGLPPTGTQATATVDALAAIHAAWWDHTDALQVVSLRDDAWIDGRARSAARAVDGLLAEAGGHLAPGMRRALAEARTAYDGPPPAQSNGTTIVHGDAHAWNCLTPTIGGAPVLLDWEAWTVDSGAYDLASLIALRFDPETRRLLEPGLLRRYHDRLLALGVERYGWDVLLADYRNAVLRRVLVPAFQWRRGVPVATWWNNLSRISIALADLDDAR